MSEAPEHTEAEPEERAEARVEPTIDDIDELVGPATPHFAMQLRARVRDLVRDLPGDHPVRQHANEKIALLERLAFASSKAEEGPKEPSTRPGWEELPSHARASEPQEH
ncbi:MAG TPA: hypothetical protein VFG85_10815 [Gaiellaceae bacterium]|jgi:hypothetical protein|nr:hypothetical protein [Gaiellaceae bacterium]